MVWVLHCGSDARCHRNYTKEVNINTIVLGGNRGSRGHSCGSIFGGCGGGNIWSMLGTGIGISLGARLFGGLTSWPGGGSFLGGLGFGGGYPYSNGYNVGGFNPFGNRQQGRCTCGCNGNNGINQNNTWRDTLNKVFGEYSVKPGTKKTDPDASKVAGDPNASKDPTGKVGDPNAVKVGGEGDPKPESAIDKFKNDPINNIPELTTENIDEILKLIKNGDIKLNDNEPLKKALKAKLEPLVADLKKPDGKYKFTLDFDKLKKLELLCNLDPKTIVDVACNKSLLGKTGFQPWKHGRIENVTKDANGKIKFTINNSNVTGEFGLKYDYEQVEGNTFKQTAIKDGDTKKKSDYNTNDDYAKTKVYTFKEDGFLETEGNPDVRSK